MHECVASVFKRVVIAGRKSVVLVVVAVVLVVVLVALMNAPEVGHAIVNLLNAIVSFKDLSSSTQKNADPKGNL